MYRTRLTLKPGAPGTMQLVNEYGPRLVCVRYRYDEARQMRIKTIELIVDQKPWTPETADADPMEYVHVRIPMNDYKTRHAISRLGGIWSAETRTFRLTYAAATLLHVLPFIVVPSTPPQDIHPT